MPGLDSLLGVWDTKTVRGQARETEARELLHKIADQVKPICVAHKWKVQMLEEFIPPNASLLGMNVNRQKIFIRLRPARAKDSFYPYEALLHTMLHELVHMEIGPHSAKFYKMLDELRDECEKLMREGITGSNMPFAGDGRSLGGGRAPTDARTAALKAAEKRQRQQGIMGGGHRLGGSTMGAGSAAERAAAAAQWRQAVSSGCTITGDGGCHGGSTKGCGSSTFVSTGSSDGDGWDCELCTLHNTDPNASACDACGTAQPIRKTAVIAAGAGGAAAPAPRSSVDHSYNILRAKRGVDGRQESGRSRPAVGRTTASTAGRTNSSSSSSSSSITSARRSIGDPILGTWTCRKCPFAFPNPAERNTCESCGASKAHPGEGVNGQQEADRKLAVERGSGRWACAACTFSNRSARLVCDLCDAPRQSRVDFSSAGGAASAASVISNPPRDVGNRNNRVPAEGTPSAGGNSSTGGGRVPIMRTCASCTFINADAKAVACRLCETPLAESATALVAAGGEEESPRARRFGGREARSTREAVQFSNGAEVIDLS